MRKRRTWAFVLVLLLAISLLSGEVRALVRVGGGVGFVGGEAAPVGRVVLDVLPLWFIALSLDVEYWLLPDRGELLPFLTASTTLILQATLGAGPLLAFRLADEERKIALQGVGLKAGIGTALGPLGLFAEAIVLPGADAPLAPPLRVRGELRFAVGATLRF